MPTGKITKWIEHRGFGFIAPDDGTESIFSHISSWPAGSAPHAGDRVSFEVHTGLDGRAAAVHCAPFTAEMEEANRVFGDD